MGTARGQKDTGHTEVARGAGESSQAASAASRVSRFLPGWLRVAIVLAVSLSSGVVWGIIAAATAPAFVPAPGFMSCEVFESRRDGLAGGDELIYGLAAFPVGLIDGIATHFASRRLRVVVPAATVLGLLSILVGEIVAVSRLIGPCGYGNSGGGQANPIALYPEFVARGPVAAAIPFLSALIGALFGIMGARWLWRRGRRSPSGREDQHVSSNRGDVGRGNEWESPRRPQAIARTTSFPR